MKLYRYQGPPEICAALMTAEAAYATARQQITHPSDVETWCEQHHPASAPMTFVVDEDGTLWIADRHSEHVACARGGRVRAAGEITFQVKPSVRVIEITNQSTGYCPEPDSYEALDAALEWAGLPHPSAYTLAFAFRRCGSCGLLNVVKDDDWVCAACQAPLSATWNCA